MRYKFVITLLIITYFQAALADCFFVRLKGYQITQRYDFLYWGEFSPLIALEAGYFYNLSPHGMRTTSQSKGTVKNLPGELYYIPQHLINKDNQFPLRMIVFDRDKDTSDDIVLPLSERFISLDSSLFTNNSYNIDVFIRRFSKVTIASNDQMYQFEIIKNSKNCRIDSVEGRENDHRYRDENRLKRLQLHIQFYEEPFLNGGHEYLSYQSPEIKYKSHSKALSKATIVAAMNSNELISLGSKLKMLNKSEGFSVVWNEYKKLIDRLLKQRLTVKYLDEKIWKKINIPTLTFHPKWEEMRGRTGTHLPKKWQIDLTRHSLNSH